MIKSNIDLTSNEMFSHIQFPYISAWKILCDKFPWNYRKMRRIESDADFRPKFEGILTGNREERRLKKDCININTGDICDRCGVSLNLIPWNRYYDLCENCWNDLEKVYGKKYPWSYIEETNTGNISLNW